MRRFLQQSLVAAAALALAVSIGADGAHDQRGGLEGPAGQLAGTPGRQGGGHPMSRLDRTAVAVVDGWISAYQGDDPQRVIDLYTDDAVIAVQGRATVNGRQEIAALLRDSFSRHDRKVSVRYDRAEVEGRWAYVYGRSWITLTPRDGSQPTDLSGRFTVLLRLCDDGQWRIFIDMDQPSKDVDPANPHFGDPHR